MVAHGRGGGRRGRGGPDDKAIRKQIGDRRMIGWFYGSLRPYWKWVLLGTSALLLGVGAEVAPPRLFGIFIDDVLYKQQIGLLPKIALLLLGCFAATAFFSAIRMATMHILAQRMVYDLRLRVHAHLQRLSLSYFESNSTGDVMSRLSNDVGAVENMVSHGTDTIIGDVVRLIVLIVLMVTTLPKLALVSLIPVPIFILAIVWFGRKIRPYYEKVRDQLGEINAHLQENITGIRVVKAFAREKHEERLFEKASLKYYEAYCKGVKMWTTFFPSLGFITSLSIVAIVWFGGRMSYFGTDDVTPGQLVEFLGYMQMFYGPVRSLIGVHNMINQALAALARIFVVLDTDPEITNSPDAVDIERIEGRVEFDDVSFKYHTGEQVLKGVNVTAEPGETVAVVGRSGAGKTSIINLIPRFYDAMEGAVRVDGTDVRDITVESLRGQIAIVLQDTFLFDDTVRENIRYGRLRATDEEVEEAAKSAFAHEFIAEDLPDGYDTEIGERGVKLSGGQKQRMAIARALLADPRILILDEATSSVDTEAERVIQAAINRLVRGRTTFVIAHRLSTIVNADQILVLDGGEIIERGTHAELIALAGVYKEMYDRQFDIPEIDANGPVAPSTPFTGPPPRFPEGGGS